MSGKLNHAGIAVLTLVYFIKQLEFSSVTPTM